VGASSNSPPVKSDSSVGVGGLLAAGQVTNGALAENVTVAANEGDSRQHNRHDASGVEGFIGLFIGYSKLFVLRNGIIPININTAMAGREGTGTGTGLGIGGRAWGVHEFTSKYNTYYKWVLEGLLCFYAKVWYPSPVDHLRNQKRHSFNST
jgi:hypothetical protein